MAALQSSRKPDLFIPANACDIFLMQHNHTEKMNNKKDKKNKKAPGLSPGAFLFLVFMLFKIVQKKVY